MSSTKKDIQLERNSPRTHTSSISWRMVRNICFAFKLCIFVLSLSVFLPICFARNPDTDTITMNDSISGEKTIISAGQKFELGFFDFHGIKYVGIWYYESNPKICVWVANRDTPLNNSSGVFRIAEDGNLVLFDESNNTIWNTSLQGWDSFKGKVQLLDTGNLVLKREDEESQSFRVIWESFKNPTDTFLPGMKMDEKLTLVSWKGGDDPAQGEYKFQREEGGKQFVIKEGYKYRWKSRIGGNFLTDDILPIVSSLLLNTNKSDIDPGTLIFPNRTGTISSNFSNSNTRLVMRSDGKVEYLTRPEESAQWNSTWSQPTDRCDWFEACGDSASCSSSKNGPICDCLIGFEPVLPDKWKSKEFSEGCRRITPLCSSNDEKFTNFSTRKVIKVGKPDGNFEVNNEIECQDKCLKDCKCQAYSCTTSQPRERKNTTCWIWLDDLNNIQLDEFQSDDIQLNSTDGELKIHLRVKQNVIAEANPTQQEGEGYVRNKQFNQWTIIIAVIVVASVTALAFTVAYIYTRKVKVKNREHRGSDLPLSFYDGQRHVKELIDSGSLNEEDKKNIDLPFFDFESILAATDDFSEANKLGKGGFGPVYKGKFSGGQEIAVKRLSRVSGQGLEEFKNEVVLIARLQHRNLVRLLGYCTEGDEKILLYEFMPNKSLDLFIFDSNLNELLDWEMRFNIILGIARGLLYLHQDSRLRIIHRDLKTSNILLDEEMNPKISDFGLARIFEGKQTEGTTNRVVGTYGYMSPEYALDGFFSIKSDVFSFGVVILEIISGKKNTGFYNSQEALSLLGYAWRLWQEDKALDMMEKKLSASSNTRTHEILKCINVGLLCVQEDPDDRPSMSDVVILLSSATAALPAPKRPAFVMRKVFHTMASSSSSSKAETNNEMTITLEGR